MEGAGKLAAGAAEKPNAVVVAGWVKVEADGKANPPVRGKLDIVEAAGKVIVGAVPVAVTPAVVAAGVEKLNENIGISEV